MKHTKNNSNNQPTIYYKNPDAEQSMELRWVRHLILKLYQTRMHSPSGC